MRAVIGDGSVTLFGRSMNAAAIAQALTTSLSDSIGDTGSLITLTAASFAELFVLLLTPVLLFYFLVSGPSLARGVVSLLPPDQRPRVRQIWSRLDPLLKRYFVGVAAVMTYAVLAAYVGLGLVLGIRHAVVLALLTGLLEMIPVVGPATAIAVAGLVALQQATGPWAILGYAIYATVLRLSIDQLLGPLLLGQAARLNPVVIIFCFLSGGLLFGVAGVIMAVPVALGIKVTLKTIYGESPMEETPD